MTRNLLAVLILMAAIAAPVFGHHSEAAEYDSTKPVKVTGTIKKVEWQNPHVWFYVDVKDENGKITTWGFSAAPPGSLMRRGITKDALTIGAVVNVEGLTRKGRFQQRFGPHRDVCRRQECIDIEQARAHDEKPKSMVGRSCSSAGSRDDGNVTSPGRSAHAGREAGLFRHLHAAFDREPERARAAISFSMRTRWRR